MDVFETARQGGKAFNLTAIVNAIRLNDKIRFANSPIVYHVTRVRKSGNIHLYAPTRSKQRRMQSYRGKI